MLALRNDRINSCNFTCACTMVIKTKDRGIVQLRLLWSLLSGTRRWSNQGGGGDWGGGGSLQEEKYQGIVRSFS